MQNQDIQRRFGGVQRLYGAQALCCLAETHVLLAGVGGVGSWAAEALARSGIGTITLVDMDHVAESNINRQVHALTNTLGMAKIQAMAQRMTLINSSLQVNLVDDFISPENAETLIAQYKPNYVIDCTDLVPAKIAMLLSCRRLQVEFLLCGGAGGKTNPLAMQYSDLAFVRNDALLSKMRQQLRKQYAFPKGSDAQGKALRKIPKMGVQCVWLDQPAILPWQSEATSNLVVESNQSGALQGLSCAGYGSCVTVTASMGFAVANLILQRAQKS